MNFFKSLKLLGFLCSSLLFFIGASFTYGQSIEELKGKIQDRNNAIQQLEEDIKKYQTEIDALGKEKDTLGNTLKSLDISKKKLEADTKITQNKIVLKIFVSS